MQLDLVVTNLPLAVLVPYAENARNHSDSQVGQIAGSIREFGFVNPVLVDADGVLIAGHGRVLAAKRLGLATVPALRLGHLSPAQARALRLADNQIALNSGWDDALLAAEIARIRDEAVVDLDVLGFSGIELDRLLASIDPEAGLGTADGDPDAPVQEPPANPVTRPGDLWRLGRHRLLCGDATSAADVARLLGGTQPHLMVTDPPYGVNYEPEWRNQAGVSATMRTGKVANDDRADWRAAWALFPGDVAYIWHAGVHARTVIESLEAAGFIIRSQIVWAKPRLVLGRGDYHWQHEPCLYAVRKGATGHWQGARDQTTLWSIGAGPEDMATVHGDGTWHAEAGGMHAPADAEQQRGRRGDLRAVLRQRHQHHRGGGDGPGLPGDRDQPRILRCGAGTLAGDDGPAGRPGRGGPHLRGYH
jgi:hypothetical protein